jgi:hypothetical protein
MKIVSLKSHARVGDQLRSPDDGPVQMEDVDADRLIDSGLAEDVSAEFPDGLQPPAEDAPAAKAPKSAA